VNGVAQRPYRWEGLDENLEAFPPWRQKLVIGPGYGVRCSEAISYGSAPTKVVKSTRVRLENFDRLNVAVGTIITDRPPHRTVRAALPHTAPTLEDWRAMLLLAHRTILGTLTSPHCVGLVSD